MNGNARGLDDRRRGDGAKRTGSSAGSALLVDLALWSNPASREDRFDCTIPDYQHRLLKLVGLSAMPKRRQLMDTFAFCLAHGVRRLESLPGVSDLGSSYDAILEVEAGSDDLSWFESWSFQVEVHHGPKRRRWFRHVDPKVARHCKWLATQLGLKKSTVTALVLMCVFIEIDTVPDDVKRDMLQELREFRRRLEGRAIRAEELRTRAHSRPITLTVTFNDVLDD